MLRLFIIKTLSKRLLFSEKSTICEKVTGKLHYMRELLASLCKKNSRNSLILLKVELQNMQEPTPGVGLSIK